ncbi:neurogenic locus protein delta-like [Ylistrum balloti]|uniref:neurogenic locus protein delta-like n=1 Tax=Ylistrum balloti TaxID=509963 RepID=UPI002905B5B1|nr:neurogenic locus protein delta-like [Ylistrum balloti]
MEGLWIFLWLMSLSLVSQLPESGCQMLSSSFTWSADLDLPCDRYFDSCWQSINIKSVSDCENICTDFGSSCLSFTFGWTSGVCTISNISSYLLPVGYMDLVTSKNVSLFQRSRGEVSDLFEKWPHSTLPLPNSYTTILEGISLATCAEECTRNTHFQCQSFDFRSATQSCYLSDTRADQEGGRLEYFDDIDHYEYKQNVQEETYTMTSMLVSNQSSNGSYASCKDNPCENGGICQEIKNSNLCICSTPYRGATCGELMESCMDNRCVNGQCINGNDTYMCKCEDGYTGRHCDTDIDECLLNVCHGSDCRNTPGGYQCICPQCQFGLCVYTGNIQGCQCFPGFIGLDCSEEVDECEDVTSCLHGTCVDYVNGVECNCNQGYTGRRCDVEIIHPCDGDPCECGACVIVGDTDFQCQCPLTRRGKRCENFEEFFTSIIDPDDLTTKFYLRDDGDNGVLFEYFLWVMVAVLVLLVVTSIIMAVCVRVKRSRFHQEVGETENGTNSVRSGSSEAYRRYDF